MLRAAGELIIEYCGEVIDDEECQVRLEKMRQRKEHNFYMFKLSADAVGSLVCAHWVSLCC